MGRKNERVGMGIRIKKYDDIFDVPEGEAKNVDSVENGAVFVEPNVLRDFNGHPFKVVGKGVLWTVYALKGYYCLLSSGRLRVLMMNTRLFKDIDASIALYS